MSSGKKWWHSRPVEFAVVAVLVLLLFWATAYARKPTSRHQGKTPVSFVVPAPASSPIAAPKASHLAQHHRLSGAGRLLQR
jgi:hypothetical protein